MLPHIVRYKDKLKNGKGGTARTFLVNIADKYRDDKGLHAHEYEHVKHWYVCLLIGLLITTPLTMYVEPLFFVGMVLSVWLKGALYTFVRPVRQLMEVKAFKKQILYSPYAPNDFFARRLMRDYDLEITLEKAKELLTHG